MGRHPLYDAKRRYAHHKFKAISRNIEFNFTFEDWYQWWLDQGVDKNYAPNTLPRTKDTKCMCRYKDVGPYSLENVFCGSTEQNSKEANSKEVVIHNITYSSMKEASKQLNIPYARLWHQYHYGKQGVKIK